MEFINPYDLMDLKVKFKNVMYKMRRTIIMW